MFHLIDTFNDRLISRHRTLLAAVKADLAYDRAVKRRNGNSSYIPTVIVGVTHGEQTPVDGQDLYRAEQEARRF